MSDEKRQIKNNCLSSSFLQFKGLNTLQNEIDHEFKENFEKVSNSNPCKKYYESLKQNKIILPLEEFMQNQNKKHLSTNFDHKEVQKFLEEKDKAMQEIIINEDILKSNESEKNNKKTHFINNNNEKYLKTKNENNNKQYDNKSSHLLIFHGTFGKDQYGRIINQGHHHHHHYHHHHHHHKHHLENSPLNINNNNEEKEIKRENF